VPKHPNEFEAGLGPIRISARGVITWLLGSAVSAVLLALAYRIVGSAW
jgi:hypothetical protein